MEGDEQQRRQYEQHSRYPRGYGPELRGPSGAAVPETLDPRGGSGDDVSERYRQSQLLAARTPTTASMNPAGGNPPDLGSYGYNQGQQYATPQMQYAADYSQHAPRQPHQQPQHQSPFPPYTSQIMYHVPPQTQQSPYESVTQYQPRQSAAIEVLSNQFGVSQYYNPNESTSAPEPAPIAQQYAPAHFHPPLLYHPPGPVPQPTVGSNFTPGMGELASPNAPGPEEIEPPNPDDGRYDRAYRDYQLALRGAFQKSHDGKLAEAGRVLLEISEWLVESAAALGRSRGNPH